MIRMAVLGSGSGGNATIVECENTRILVDAGLSAKQITLRLKQLGVSADDIDGILITHEHSDHARGVDVLLRNRNIPVYANLFTREALESQMKSQISWKIFKNEREFEIGALKVNPFSILHDAADPVGFILEGAGVKLSMASDIGHITPGVAKRFCGSHAIYIEANYDMDLLERDTRRPWSTKQRIVSRHGHLSNVQVAEFLEEVACEKLGHVMLCHLSADCNCPSIASKIVSDALNKRGLHAVQVHCAQQDQSTDWIVCKN